MTSAVRLHNSKSTDSERTASIDPQYSGYEMIGIPLDILGSDAHGIRIVVAADHPLAAQEPCGNGKNAGAGPKIQNKSCGVHFTGVVFETFQRQLRGFVSSGSERLPRINSNGQCDPVDTLNRTSWE